MATQCFTGPGLITLLARTGSFSVVSAADPTITIGSFSGTPYNASSTSSDSTVGKVEIPAGEWCATYPDNWGDASCTCPPIPQLTFTFDSTGGGDGGINQLELVDCISSVPSRVTRIDTLANIESLRAPWVTPPYADGAAPALGYAGFPWAVTVPNGVNLGMFFNVAETQTAPTFTECQEVSIVSISYTIMYTQLTDQDPFPTDLADIILGVARGTVFEPATGSSTDPATTTNEFSGVVGAVTTLNESTSVTVTVASPTGFTLQEALDLDFALGLSNQVQYVIENIERTVIYEVVDVCGSQALPTSECNSSAILSQITNLLAATENAVSLNTVLLPDVCANVDGVPSYVQPVVTINPATAAVVSTIYLDARGVAISGAVTVAQDCDCECQECNESLGSFDISVIRTRTATRYTFDDPTFAFSNSIGAIDPDNWDVNEFVADLNAQIGQAIPFNVASGIDYTSTVFAVDPDNPDFVIVVAGTPPFSISLSTLGVDLPLIPA